MSKSKGLKLDITKSCGWCAKAGQHLDLCGKLRDMAEAEYSKLPAVVALIKAGCYDHSEVRCLCAANSCIAFKAEP